MADQGALPQETRVAMVICKNPLCVRFSAVPFRPELCGEGRFMSTCTECKHENEYRARDFHEADGRTRTAINPLKRESGILAEKGRGGAVEPTAFRLCM